MSPTLDAGPSLDATAPGRDTATPDTDTGMPDRDAGEEDDARAPPPVPPPPSPPPPPPPEATTRVFMGGANVCAVLPDGDTWCWGSSSGELGLSAFELTPCGLSDCALEPVLASRWGAVDEISLEQFLGCAMTTEGLVQCAGNDLRGQLGNGGPGREEMDIPGIVLLDGDAISVSSGGSFGCAVLGSGVVQCWGDNFTGQLGMRGPETCGIFGECSQTPLSVPGLSGIERVVAAGSSLGSGFAFAIDGDGDLRSWGLDIFGTLGVGGATESCGPPDDPFACSHGPIPVPGLTGVSDLSCATYHCCAVADGEVSCWGSGSAGKLGDGAEVMRNAPTRVPGLSGVVQIAAGTAHTCARLADGTARCWGRNESGELGVPIDADVTCGEAPDTFPCVRSPVEVAGLDGIAWIAAGGNSTCAATPEGEVSCWGANFAAQLGRGTMDEDPHPERMAVVGLP